MMPGGNTRTVIHVAAVPAHDRARRGRAPHRRRRPRVRRLPRRVHRRPLRPLAPGRSCRRSATALDDGISFGAPNRYETELARGGLRALPLASSSCGSATRAPRRTCSRCRSRASRPASPRSWSSRAATTAASSSSRRPPARRSTRRSRSSSAQYNDAEGAARLIAEHAHELAAVDRRAAAGLGRRHSRRARRSFGRLREATAEHDVLLVFDEVMTSRLSTGGLQQVARHHARPDDARQVPRRRARVRRLRRPRRPDAALRPVARRTRCRTRARSTTPC